MLSLTHSGFCAGHCDIWYLISSNICTFSSLPLHPVRCLSPPAHPLFFNLKHPSGNCHDWSLCNTAFINGLTALSISSLQPHNARNIQADRLASCPLLSEGLVHFSVANVPFLHHILIDWEVPSLWDWRWMLLWSKITCKNVLIPFAEADKAWVVQSFKVLEDKRYFHSPLARTLIEV